jgi:hypothetical protein
LLQYFAGRFLVIVAEKQRKKHKLIKTKAITKIKFVNDNDEKQKLMASLKRHSRVLYQSSKL